ncbi:MAG: hypothetical protein ABJ092_14445 [Gillisia sp.]
MELLWNQIVVFNKAFLRNAGSLLLVLSLFNCATGQAKYPQNWSPRVETAVTDYSGRYNAALIRLLNVQTLTPGDTTECLYDFIISVNEIKYRPDCPHLNEALSTGYIPLSVVDYNLKLEQKEEGLKITYQPLKNGGNPVAGYQKEYVLLSKSLDGSLIVEKVGKVYGLVFMIFPVAASEHIWYRFYDGKVEALE